MGPAKLKFHNQVHAGYWGLLLGLSNGNKLWLLHRQVLILAETFKIATHENIFLAYSNIYFQQWFRGFHTWLY